MKDRGGALDVQPTAIAYSSSVGEMRLLVLVAALASLAAAAADVRLGEPA